MSPVDWPLEPAHRERSAEVDRFVERDLDPAEIDEESDDAPHRMLELLGAAGLLGWVVPAAYGGRAEPLDLRTICCVRERLAYASGLADLMFVMQGLGSSPVRLAGSEELRQRWLPGLLTGQEVAAIALTEPAAGSDLGSIELRAGRDGDDYVLDGEKRFISNAGVATFFSVLARTGEAVDRGRGLTFLLVEADRPGVSVEPMPLISDHPVGRVVFSGCRVPASHRLGAEGGGLDVALATLGFFRASVGAAAVGFAARALAEALDHVRRRRQFGRLLAEFQGTQHRLADMATEIDAARLLVHQAAAALDAGRNRPAAVSMAKLFPTEMAGRVVDAAVQLHGGSGLVRGAVVERLYREVRALRIYEGTSEIQRSLIAREILR